MHRKVSQQESCQASRAAAAPTNEQAARSNLHATVGRAPTLLSQTTLFSQTRPGSRCQVYRSWGSRRKPEYPPAV